MKNKTIRTIGCLLLIGTAMLAVACVAVLSGGCGGISDAAPSPV